MWTTKSSIVPPEKKITGCPTDVCALVSELLHPDAKTTVNTHPAQQTNKHPNT